MTGENRYAPAVGTAILSGLFCLFVAAAMGWNHARARFTTPLDSVELQHLKTRLKAEPRNEEIKGQIRDLDWRLRREFFWRRQISMTGAWLLLGGGVVFVSALNAAAARRRDAAPWRTEGASAGWAAIARVSRAALAGAAVFLAAVSLVWLAASKPKDMALIRAAAETPPPASAAAPVELAVYPSAEEMQRNWPRFRGPDGLGISSATNPPVAWNGPKKEHVLWKTAAGANGKNSPVVWGRRVFLTGADARTRKVVCFDADTGRRIWEKPVIVEPAPAGEPTVMEEDTGYAAPTAAADGQRVYAIFANGDLAAFDFEGSRVWGMNLGVPDNIYGHAASLLVWRNLIVVQYDQGSADDVKSRILAFDGPSGSLVWETPRPVGASWATPITVTVGETEQIVACAKPWVIAYDPATGAEIWRASALDGEVAPSPASASGTVYVANQGASLAAIRADGRGDVTASHVLWTATDGLPDICSVLCDGRYVFLLTTGGLLTCYRAADGRKLWEQEFDTSFFASPTLAGGLVYLISEEGSAIMFRPGDAYQETGRAELGEKVYASPAFAGSRMYIRGAENLYCIGTK